MNIIQRRILIGGLLAAPFIRPWRAAAQTLSPGSPAFQRLYQTGVNVGNGADITDDILQTYTLPAGQLANVGDALSMLAAGSFATSADSKVARLKFGNVVFTTQPSVAGTTPGWRIQATIIKTGANAQGSEWVIANGLPGFSDSVFIGNSPQTVTDTAAITIVVTGQNVTNPVASSISCRVLIIDFIRGT
jgi:hypothetical protein